jgi:hypothetical protein
MVAQPCINTASAAHRTAGASKSCSMLHDAKDEMIRSDFNCVHLQQADAGGCLRQQHEVNAARQCRAHRAIASAAFCCRQQALRRQVRRHQGAGACGVRADAGPLMKSQNETVGQPGLAKVYRNMKACSGSALTDTKFASIRDTLQLQLIVRPLIHPTLLAGLQHQLH